LIGSVFQIVCQYVDVIMFLSSGFQVPGFKFQVQGLFSIDKLLKMCEKLNKKLN